MAQWKIPQSPVASVWWTCLLLRGVSKYPLMLFHYAEKAGWLGTQSGWVLPCEHTVRMGSSVWAPWASTLWSVRRRRTPCDSFVALLSFSPERPSPCFLKSTFGRVSASRHNFMFRVKVSSHLKIKVRQLSGERKLNVTEATQSPGYECSWPCAVLMVSGQK